ncbi:MAG: hypothetical protein INR64_11580, partial [Caulobacteraceae bacterium]|nr:hypothetical protein [Caulobacter sp.]
MFLAYLSAFGDTDEARLDACAGSAGAAGLKLLASLPGARLMGAGRPPAVRTIGAGVVVGDLFYSAPGRVSAPADLQGGRDRSTGTARTLLSRYWGGYVAILRDPIDGGWRVLRDPSGAREAIIWCADDIWRIADTLDFAPALAPQARIDGSGLAGWLADPVRLSGDLALAGVEAVAPGELRSLGSGVSARASAP